LAGNDGASELSDSARIRGREVVSLENSDCMAQYYGGSADQLAARNEQLPDLRSGFKAGDVA